MKIRLIGLGKMGENIALNLIDKNHTVYGYDNSSETRNNLSKTKINIKNSLNELLERENDERLIVWLLVPNSVVDSVIDSVLPHLTNNDIIIDAGNSNFNLSIKRYEYLKERNIDFIDLGTSGGKSGARYGACLMAGGEYEVVKYVEQVFIDVSVKDGYGYFGKPGSGHFVKMVHNGIEYGMMQAIGEGMEFMERSPFDIDYEKVTKVWDHGSIIESRLISDINKYFKGDSNLSSLAGRIDDSGEGKWMIEEALNYEVSIPVIANSLFVRYKSRDKTKFSEKSVAAMRNVFGGHDIYSEDEE